MLILDFLLLMLVSICIVYCLILNRRIHDLQNSRIEFARMIKELNASIVKAENNVNEMNELSKVTTVSMKQIIDESKSSSDCLNKLIIEAGSVADELRVHTKSAIDAIKSTMQDHAEYAGHNFKGEEKFSDDDLADLVEQKPNNNYANQLINLIQKVVSKNNFSDKISNQLNQSGYYNTLRRINIKK